MRCFILNNAMLIAPGRYEYRQITPEEAMSWIKTEVFCFECGRVALKPSELTTECYFGPALDEPEYGGCLWSGVNDPFHTKNQVNTVALSELLGVSVHSVRDPVRMMPGDEALVFRLTLPASAIPIYPSDRERICLAIHSKNYELGLLVCIL